MNRSLPKYTHILHEMQLLPVVEALEVGQVGTSFSDYGGQNILDPRMLLGPKMFRS